MRWNDYVDDDELAAIYRVLEEAAAEERQNVENAGRDYLEERKRDAC